MIVVDDNIRNEGGHFYELATLLMSAGTQSGFQPILAANADFEKDSREDAASDPPLILPTFHTRRMLRWSLGVDGESNLARNLAGSPSSGNWLKQISQSLRDRYVPPTKHPQRMLAAWQQDFVGLLAQLKPTADDRIVISTGDDFLLLALAAALKEASLTTPLRIDIILHFALTSLGQPDESSRLQLIGQQSRQALAAMQPHDIHLHATTSALTDQWRRADPGTAVTTIPYPTRKRKISQEPSAKGPTKVVFAGLPRAEKGREAIHGFLEGIHRMHLKNRHYRVSMQMPSERWESMIPTALHSSYEQAAQQNATQGHLDGPLEVMTANLSTEQYHAWLDTADLGLFLYDPDRYQTRCSGVLLEMLARGIPVVVPDGCWLADQVRQAGGHRSIGFIYQDRSEIPDLMQQFLKHQRLMRSRAMSYAKKIRQHHDGVNTLRVMGLVPDQTRHQDRRDAA